MRYDKCCVPGCNNKRKDVIMHKFPNSERRLKRWLDSINCGSLRAMETIDLSKLTVCHNHFENRFITVKSRLLGHAYPALFTAEEITSGRPSTSQPVRSENYPTTDHCYARKRQNEHSYAASNLEQLPQKKSLHTMETLTDHEMDITENDVEDLGFNNLNPKLTQMLDNDNEWGELRLSSLRTTTDQSVLEHKNAVLVCDESGMSAVNDNSDLETLKEININGEIVPKMKKVDDDVLLVSGDDNNDSVMEMDSATPIIPEDFHEDGYGEHEVLQEHQGFCCNVCLGKIVGFRYRCCECVDYDMCSDCESRGEHPLHYVLRVPGYRKQCEVRRVMAAVHLALAFPPDVKDELTIKIEDPGEEPPPDPLDTAEAAPTEPEPMENVNPTIPLICTELTPPPAKVPRVEPSKRREVLKLVRSNKTAIPVALDALRRKAIVRLNKLKLPRKEIPAQTEPLDEDTQRKHTTDTSCGTSATKKDIRYTRDPSKSLLQNIDHVISTKHSATQHFQSKRKLKTFDLSQTARKSKEVKILPQNITMNRDNIVVVEQTDDAIVETNAGEDNFVVEQTDDCIVETNVGENIFVVEQNHDATVEANSEEVIYMTEEEFNALISTGKLNHDIVVQESPGDETLLLYPPMKSKTICDK